MQSYVMHKPANDPIFTFIEKKRGEGKSGKLAMVAGLNKFLRSDTSYPIGQCCVEIANMDEEVLEPPAFWSVGCLPRKIASFLLEFGAFRRGSFRKVSVVSNQPCSFHSYSGSKVGQILNILHDIKHRKPDTSKPCEGLGYLIDSGASYV